MFPIQPLIGHQHTLLSHLFLPTVGRYPVLTMSRFQSFPDVPSQHSMEQQISDQETVCYSGLHSHSELAAKFLEYPVSFFEWLQVCLEVWIGQ